MRLTLEELRVTPCQVWLPTSYMVLQHCPSRKVTKSTHMPTPCSETRNTPFTQFDAAVVSCNTDLTLYQTILKGENNQLPHGTLRCGRSA